jgi:hypothetical protein
MPLASQVTVKLMLLSPDTLVSVCGLAMVTLVGNQSGPLVICGVSVLASGL